MARSKKLATKELDPSDVLSGRSRLGPRDFIALIRKVNPSGQDLPEREARRRYALKSRLQSLLIQSFEGEIAAHPEPDQPGVVLLVHRSTGLQACHAVLSELDDNARSRVQRLLDEAESESYETGPASAITRPQQKQVGLVEQGRRALAEFDFDAAREAFERALKTEEEETEGARALLELLVDHLADDRAALDLLPVLSPAALGEGDVRLLLGVAAARTAARTTALEMIAGCVSPRVADVYAWLARHALEAGDVEAARDDLERCRGANPAHPEADWLAAELDKARSARLHDLEGRAAKLVDEGSDREAWRIVQAVLREAPASTRCLALRAQLERRKARARVADLLQRTEAARASAEDGTALAMLREAAALEVDGDEQARIAHMMAQLKATVRERADVDRVERVVGLLLAEPGKDAYESFLECRTELRDAIRARCATPELGWIEQIVESPPEARPKAIASAIDALMTALRVCDEKPELALELLSANRRLLCTLEPYLEVLQTAERLAAERRTTRALSRLEDARRAASCGDFEAVIENLRGPTLVDLPQEARDEWRRLHEQALREVELDRRIRGLESRARSPMPFDAIPAAQEMIRTASGNERERLQLALQTIRRRIRRTFRFHSWLEEAPLGRGAELAVGARSQAWRSLLPDGQTVLAPFSRGRWLFVIAADPARGISTKRALLHCPDSLSGGTFAITGDRIVMPGDTGTLLELDLQTLEPLAWRKLPLLAPALIDPLAGPARDIIVGRHNVVRLMQMAPGERFLWVWEAEASPPRVRIIELAKLNVVRELRELKTNFVMRALPEVQPPAVLVTQTLASGRTNVMLYDPDGRRRFEVEFDATSPLVIAHPDGSEPIVVESLGISPDAMAGAARWWITRLDGTQALFEMKDGGTTSAPYAAVTDPDARLLYVIEASQCGELTLVCLAAEPSGALALRYQIPIPAQSVLCQPVSGGAVSALVACPEGLRVVALGADRPNVPSSPIPHTMKLPEFGGLEGPCDMPWGTLHQQAAKVLEWIRSVGPKEASSVVRQHIESGDVGRAMVHITALKIGHLNAEEGDLLRALRAHHSDHPWVRAAHAHVSATLGDWKEVVDWADGVVPEHLHKCIPRHFLHVVAVAHMQLGHGREAREALLAASQHAGPCDLTWLQCMAAPLEDLTGRLVGRSEPWPAITVGFRELLRDIVVADELLDKGDFHGALQVLDVVPVWQLSEVQTLARLAQACLSLDASAVDPFRAGLILMSFADRHGERSLRHRRELPLLEGRWDQRRLNELASRANAWMDARFG